MLVPTSETCRWTKQHLYLNESVSDNSFNYECNNAVNDDGRDVVSTRLFGQMRTRLECEMWAMIVGTKHLTTYPSLIDEKR